MNRNDAKSTLLVRAVELADPNGVLLPIAIRKRCTEEARPPSAETAASRSEATLTEAEQAFLVRRAQCAVVELESRMPDWASFRDSLDLVPHLLRWIPGLALFGGIVAARGWSGDKLNLLGLPLFTIVLWNLVVYGYLAYSALRPAPRTLRTGPFRAGLSTWAVRYQAKLARAAVEASGDSKAAVSGQAATRFLREWLGLQSSLIATRGVVLLHLSAAALAGGLALGLLLFGIVGLLGDLNPGWSTNLPKLMPAKRVHELLTIVFAPASALTPFAVPQVDEIEKLRFGDQYQGGSAEDWLFLSMVSLLLYVVVPRLALWGFAHRRANRIQDGFYSPSAGDSYYRDLIQRTRGAGQVAGVVWHHIDMTSELQTRTRAALRTSLGGRVKLDFAGQVPYGQEGDVLTMLAEHDPRERLVVVVSIADTPEDEVQGELIQQLAAYGPPGEERAPLIVLDPAPYERFREAPAFRQHYDERMRLWQQFAADHHAEVILLEPPGRGDAAPVSA